MSRLNEYYILPFTWFTTRVVWDLVFRKQLQFSTFKAQDVVKVSEFQVTHRDLYTATDRAPVKNGVLDRRLVRLCSIYRHIILRLSSPISHSDTL